MSDTKPNPGSQEAQDKGCTCAVMDNGYGKGAYMDDKGRPLFWVSSECPMHGQKEPPHDR